MKTLPLKEKTPANIPVFRGQKAHFYQTVVRILHTQVTICLYCVNAERIIPVQGDHDPIWISRDNVRDPAQLSGGLQPN